MEVMIPSPTLDLDFNSARSSPHVTSPTTPTGFGGYYISAPTSPSHLSRLYPDFKSPPAERSGDDFAFDVSQELETASLSAEELFDAGVIKPLKSPPQLQVTPAETHVISPNNKTAVVSDREIIQGAFSPRQINKNTGDPFTIAAPPPQRGRDRGMSMPKSSSRRAARSLSPLRDTQHRWEEEEKEHMKNTKVSSSSSGVYSTLSTSVKGQKKWRLRDFFLFRNASEGRAAEKDPLKKYTAAIRHASIRSIEGPGSGSGSRRNGHVSAHELHYTVNRAVSEDLKKKTFLPYKQGILGRLAFNPAVHALANGFGFSRN